LGRTATSRLPPDGIDVSIIVVSYNTRQMTADALASVLTETHATTYEIIAVDNASADGSAAMLAGHPAHPQLIALKDNIGFARADVGCQISRPLSAAARPDTIVRDVHDRLVRLRALIRRRSSGGVHAVC
jgi:cellulose synthase/poly-beta-1,6-N-acetylglucosamine synthase-like glycosyltransferase